MQCIGFVWCVFNVGHVRVYMTRCNIFCDLIVWNAAPYWEFTFFSSDSPRSSSRQPPKQLRNLLPWNYLASPEDQVPSPRRGARDPDLEMPPVPVPDYTLHFRPKKRERIVSNNSATSSVGKTSWSIYRPKSSRNDSLGNVNTLTSKFKEKSFL